MPATNYGEANQIVNLFGRRNQNPTAYSIGLIPVDLVWTASTTVTLNQYCIPTAFNSGGTSQRIFKATAVSGTGQTSSSQPNFAGVAQGGTVTETVASPASSITWTECTNLFFNTTTGTWQGPEVGAGLGYSRQTMDNTTAGSWSNPAAGALQTVYGTGTSVTWGAAIGFGTSNAKWGYLAGYVLFDGSGNAWHFGYLNSYLAVLSSGITVSIPTSPSPVTVTLT